MSSRFRFLRPVENPCLMAAFSCALALPDAFDPIAVGAALSASTCMDSGWSPLLLRSGTQSAVAGEALSRQPGPPINGGHGFVLATPHA